MSDTITYERFFAVAVGQMGITPDVFNDMTPAEFCYAWTGWHKMQTDLAKGQWERIRWSTRLLSILMVDKKNRNDIVKMTELPWDHDIVHSDDTAMTIEERRERVKEMLSYRNGKTDTHS